jgi:phosphate transport system substrate-binding protein
LKAVGGTIVKKATITALALAIVTALTLATESVRVGAQDSTPATDLSGLSGTIESDGSSTVGPLTEAVAEEFNAQAGEVRINVGISGTGGGFERFCAGETDIQNASRDIDAEEVAACEASGVDFYRFEVAYDGLTVVTNAENEFLECLTVDELKTLWEPNSTVTNWSDLNPDFPEEEVVLFGPGTDSGTFDYFTDAIVGEEGASREDYTPSEDDNVIVEGVAGDPNSLGYFGYAYYEQNQDRLKAIQVDGGSGCVGPSPETIQDGSYTPLSRPLYVFAKAESLERPEVQEFMRFYLAQAPALAPEVGYVASPAETYAADTEKLEGAISGAVEPDGLQADGTPEA